MQEKVIIIGAGLSGLLLAKRLKDMGIHVLLLEARDRIGGRIQTLETTNTPPVEMGATWFHPQHPLMGRLLQELGIAAFVQHMDGAAFYEPMPGAAIQKVQLPHQPPSYRITGGTGTVIQSLAEQLSNEELLLKQEVQAIHFNEKSVEVITNEKRFKGDQVICCLPPKLLVNHIKFEPALPTELVEVAQHTHTWMKDSAKVMLTYKRAFWREAGLSGAMFTRTGPMMELYDHSNIELTKFALGGFLHPAYHKLSKLERQEKVVQQLVAVFGKEAGDFLTYEDLIWPTEKYTTQQHTIDPQPHQNNGHPLYAQTWFDGRLILAGAETSPHHGGYMEGAVFSAERLVKGWEKRDLFS